MNLTKFITDDTLHCEQVVINMETWICGEGDQFTVPKCSFYHHISYRVGNSYPLY